MGIKKQEFNEGAALHMLIRQGGVSSIRYEAPFFIVNERQLVHLKYCTRSRSPWGFTFMPEEQSLLMQTSSKNCVAIALICGADGVAAFDCRAYLSIARPKRSSVHVACYRGRGEHYEVNGPDGSLQGKVAPSNWLRILER